MADTDTQVRYALVDYDVHGNTKAYNRIYTHLRKIAVMFTESVYMVNMAQAGKVHTVFEQINKDLADAGIGKLTFDTVEIAEREFEKMRQRSLEALTTQIGAITKSLNESIDRLEAQYNPKTDNPNDLIDKRKVAVATAKRKLKEARGVALLFMLDKNVASAIEATDKIIEAKKLLAEKIPVPEES